MKLKDIKPYEWGIAIGVAVIGFFVVKKFLSLDLGGGAEINGVTLTEEDKKPVADAQSEAMIKELHPKFRNLARAFVNRVKKGVSATNIFSMRC